MAEIEFTREELEARAQDNLQHLKAHIEFTVSLFFIPPGRVFRTNLPPEDIPPLIPAVPYAVCARRYRYGSARLN